MTGPIKENPDSIKFLFGKRVITVPHDVLLNPEALSKFIKAFRQMAQQDDLERAAQKQSLTPLEQAKPPIDRITKAYN